MNLKPVSTLPTTLEMLRSMFEGCSTQVIIMEVRGAHVIARVRLVDNNNMVLFQSDPITLGASEVLTLGAVNVHAT